MADQPFGAALLVILALGLLAYAAGRVADASVLAGPEDSAAERGGWMVSAVIHVTLAVLAFRLATGGGGSAARSGDPSGLTARVMDAPAGRWLVGAAGLIIIGVGAFQARNGVTKNFVDELEQHPPWVEWAGAVGLLARAVAFAVVGWFAIRAALTYDAEEAKGLDGALQELAGAPYGPYLLGLVAAGLLAYALHCGTQARWRRVA